jgi:CheY-like chemotaxis protein
MPADSLAAGCNEHLVKPVSKKNLLQALDRTSSTRELAGTQ